MSQTSEIVSFTPINQDSDSKVLAFDITRFPDGRRLYLLHSVAFNGDDESGDNQTYNNLPEALAGAACKMAAQPNIEYEVEK